MGRKTKIDWCDSSWNPITGCLHGCAYCYADRMARRFGCHMKPETDFPVLDYPIRNTDTYAYMRVAGISAGTIQPYPYDFTPTFHKYRLKIPQDWKKPQTIFVCSMADMFGEWVPDEWIDQIFKACLAAPQHRYLFLTKNGKRYIELAKKGIMPDTENFWYGCSVTRPDEPFFFSDRYKTFASIEPILEPFDWVPGLNHIELPDWIITGAETGNRKDKARPEKDWLDGIVNGCAEHHIPLFMKESLLALMGDDFRQEFPWK